MKILFFILLTGIFVLSSAFPLFSSDIPVYTYKIINTYPHDHNAFTQGLIFEDGILYESTGLYGRSSLRKVDLESGFIIQHCNLPQQFFGEGITIYKDKIIWLTWRSGTGFVFDKNDFKLLQSFKYQTEGWGITNDGASLIMSDGTAFLYFLDPETFKEIGKIEVRDNNGAVTYLNELEYIEGEVYANVWQTEKIARINPYNGKITGWIELGGLLSSQGYQHPVDVLNGIAYDSKNRRIFVTGKLWSKIFEIQIQLSVNSCQ